jgi:lipid-A-disaccharide synthase
MSSKKIFISAGELSGDIHGGNLIAAIKKADPEVAVSAIGGDNMSRAGASLLYHIRETSFMGLTEVVKHFPFIRRLWKDTLRHIDQIRPDLVVVIDYPGFNLRLAKAVSKRNIPVIYYISPQVWAWHQSRVKTIKKYISEVLCILPFEEEWFRKHGVNAQFVGHPLLDQLANIEKDSIDTSPIALPGASMIIGLFPGSRKQEIERHLPVMIAAVQILKMKFPKMAVAVSIAPGIDLSGYREKYNFDWLYWIKNSNYQIMRKSDLLIMSSGTATLEATLFQTPMVVIYRLSPLSYYLGRLLVKVPFITIANLIANKKGICELIQHDASPVKIAGQAELILTSKKQRKNSIDFLTDVTHRLGKPGASERAAKIILNHIKEK